MLRPRFKITICDLETLFFYYDVYYHGYWLLSPFPPHGPREREANLSLRKRLYPPIEASIWNNMGNRSMSIPGARP